MALAIEDYALVGDAHGAALIGRDGSVDWLCLPRFDSSAVFAALLDPPAAGRWLLAPAAGGSSSRWRYRGDSLVLETDWETPSGHARVVDLRPRKGEASDLVRIVEGVSGSVRMRTELIVRFGDGKIVPVDAAARRRTPGLRRRPRRALPRHPGRAGRSSPHHHRDLHRARRAASRVRADLPGVAPARPGTAGHRPGRAGHRGVLGAVDARLHLPRALRRRRAPQPGGAQGTDLRPDRRHRRRADNQPARTARRRPQLGLPLLLAA